MEIPTEPIGSIPRPRELIDALHEHDHGVTEDGPLEKRYDDAIRDTIARFEATGSPLITDGEQRKFHNFAPFCDDTSTSRDTAFAKIRARVVGTAMAERELGTHR